ncbi:MAG: alpha-ketoglutarate-dependent dioxygenase AlkB [Gammaproteobacteria bacterium]|nr:alpha-ketoglutarate-dependent dioxygenase AlkB [Gammaproteobacteria bacterium]
MSKQVKNDQIINETQSDLFANDIQSSPLIVQRDGLDIEYRPDAFSCEMSQKWFVDLLNKTPWKQDEVVVYGKRHLAPRLSCWMGESWMTYTYSKNKMRPRAWGELPWKIKTHVEGMTGETFNSVLINYYRNGQDSNGWHADDEIELGPQPTIASLSLGASRDFYLRNKHDHKDKLKLSLKAGSLLMMRGTTQDHWQHSVPKRASAGPRINLTFRTMRVNC